MPHLRHQCDLRVVPCTHPLHLGTMNYEFLVIPVLEFVLLSSMSAQVGVETSRTTRQRSCFVYRPGNGGKLATPPNPAGLGSFRSLVRCS